MQRSVVSEFACSSQGVLPTVVWQTLWSSEPNAGRGGEDCKAQQSVPRSALLRTTAATLPQLVLVGSQHPARAAIIEEDAAERLFEAVGGSVVSIWVRMDGGGEGLGSGVIWDRKGSIVTNYHVVQKVVPDRSATQARRSFNLVDFIGCLSRIFNLP